MFNFNRFRWPLRTSREIGNIITAGLVGYWKLGEASGSVAYDSSGYGNNGTYNGTTPSTNVPPVHFPDPFSRSFNGSTDYVKFSQGLPDIPGTNITLSAWVNLVGDPGGNTGLFHTVIRNSGAGGTGTQYDLLISKARTTLLFQGVNFAAQCPSFTTLSFNWWYHTAVTYNGSQVAFYLNGTNMGSVAETAALGTRTLVGNAIGSAANGNYFLNGLLNDVRVYNRALSGGEIAMIALGIG